MITATSPFQNLYPGAGNFPDSSFPQPVPAPSVDPDDAGTLITVQYSWEWQQVLLAAVDQLLNPATWQGDHDDVITALNRATNLKDMLQTAIVGPSSVPAPFWDEESGDDSDDIAPIDDQPWYGQIVIIDDRLTFVENAFIYVVAGFIAYAGLPTAAISFVPIARTFVVTMKSNPLGGIVRFLADAVEIGRVDTYSAADGVVSAPVVMPAPAMGFVAQDVTYPVFWVELLPDNPHGLESVSMTLIRSRLSEADFSNPSQRYNPDTDTVEYTPDGGLTWVADPADDPRHSAKFAKPLLTTADPRCDAAANMVKWLRDFIDYETSLMTAGAEITGLTNAALTLFDILAPWAILAQGLIALASEIFGAGSAVLLAAFTSDQYDLMLCAFYGNIEPDGSVTPDDLAAIEAQMTADLNTTAGLITNLILSTQGEMGVQNAGVVGGQTGDCSACETCPDDLDWCETLFDKGSDDGESWTFLADDWGINGRYGLDTVDGETFYEYTSQGVSRSGGVEQANRLEMSKVMPSGNYTWMRVTMAYLYGTFLPDIRHLTVSVDGGVLYSDDGDAPAETAYEMTFDVTGTPTLALSWLGSYRNDSANGGGALRVVKWEVGGVGANPF